MNAEALRQHSFASAPLRWSVGLMLFVPALLLALHGQSSRHFGAGGYPHGVRYALATSEMLGAALFLWPRTLVLGGALLILVLLAASGLHVGLGEAPSPSFAIYIAAIYMVMVHRDCSPSKNGGGQ